MTGFSPEGLQRVHDAMASYVERGTLPGSVSLLSRGEEVHVDAIGRSAIGGRPIRRDTIFRISSMTKPVTAAAAMMLVEEGKWSLEDPIDRWLPELAGRRVLRSIESPLDDTVPAARSITVRDLLTFTMGFGLTYPFDAHPIQKAAIELRVGYGPPDPLRTPEPNEWARRFGTLPLMYQPGERWLYNTGSCVLAIAIARTSRQPFDAFLRKRIFEPLGMKDTAFYVAPSKLDRFTVSYMFNAATRKFDVFDGNENSAWGTAPAFASGADGLVSTVDDYFAFARMLLNGGEYRGKRLLSSASIDAMTRDQLAPSQKVDSDLFPRFWATHGWGFGVAIVTAPDEASRVPGRYGWDGGLGTYWFSDPSRDFIGLLFTQRAFDDSPHAKEFWKAAFRAISD